MPQQIQNETDEAKADLGLANGFLGKLIPKQEAQDEEEATEAPETPETAPEQAETPPVEEAIEEPVEEKQEDLSIKFDEFKGDIEGVIDTKFKELTKTLEDALKDE